MKTLPIQIPYLPGHRELPESNLEVFCVLWSCSGARRQLRRRLTALPRSVGAGSAAERASEPRAPHAGSLPARRFRSGQANRVCSIEPRWLAWRGTGRRIGRDGRWVDEMAAGSKEEAVLMAKHSPRVLCRISRFGEGRVRVGSWRVGWGQKVDRGHLVHVQARPRHCGK